MSTGEIEYLNPEGAPPAQGLYSHATYVPGGPLYFVAGQLAVGMDGSVVGKNDFEAQFHQVFANLRSVLDKLGATCNDVVKFNTYLVHSQHLEIFMRLRAENFPKWFQGKAYPPNTLLVVDRMVKEDFLLEVEAVVRAKA
jgi:enamine deaminase RidA (YjgF/YER057c/UK114 family)